MQPDQVKMGQGGLCGVTSPGIDSLPLMASPSFTSTSNGIATEVHVSLSNLPKTCISFYITEDNKSCCCLHYAAGKRYNKYFHFFLDADSDCLKYCTVCIFFTYRNL